ncbi:ThiF family adenylyltransferase [Paenibacillus sp. Leaf72]|uniref:ThiF family adenylyltransferase n=1 Tax=Paenibacillus sp. Leaf72 TaxID=1736234 RepID=UPI0007C7F6EB|nr:ThiF family adenylyltransferase [Paenibacillus sp. Leaf72]
MITLPKDYEPYFALSQLGAGGNGSYILQQIAQMMNIFNCDGRYIIADPDIVETKNLGNQLFIPGDVGKKKASVLARRYSSHYNLQISSYTDEYVENEEMIHNLFTQEYYSRTYRSSMFVPILIGCVDNNFSRQIMHNYFLRSERLIYIDVGIEGAKVPQDGRVKRDWTEKENDEFKNSGWVGQVVCGVRWNGETLLSPVGDLFPDTQEMTDSIAPSELSCSAIVMSEPQRLLTNKFAALEVISYFNELFSEGTISNHYSYVTLQSKVKVRTTRVENNIEL